MLTTHRNAARKTTQKTSIYAEEKRNTDAAICKYALFFTLLMLSPLLLARDNIYSWQGYQQVHFTDIPPKHTPYQLHLFHAGSINNKHAASNADKRIDDALSNHEDISTITYCENIRKTLSQLRHQKAFTWDIKSRRLVKKAPKKKLIKHLQREMTSHCRPSTKLNFTDIHINKRH